VGDMKLHEKKLFTTSEVAELLGTTRVSVWRWIKTGKIRAIKLPGGQYRIPREEVEKLLG